MLSNPPITGIIKKIPNLYTLSMAVAKRARQISIKENELAIKGHEKCVTTAAMDFYNGNVMIFDDTKKE